MRAENGRDLVSAIAARKRGRSRLRVATAIVGLGGLATAGVIAWNLPAPAHHGPAGTPAATPAQATTPAATFGPQGENDDDGPVVAGGNRTSGSAAPSHATSGGS